MEIQLKRKLWKENSDEGFSSVSVLFRPLRSQTEETRLWWCVQTGQQELSDEAPALILILIMMMMCNSELPLGGYARRIFKVKGWWAYGASLYSLLVYSWLAARSVWTCRLHLLTGRQVAASICMLTNTETHVSGQTHFSCSHRLIYLAESPRSRSPGWCWTGCLTQRLSTSCSSLGSPTPPETGYYLILKPVLAPRRAGMCVSGQAELIPWSLYWFWFPQNVIVCDSSLSVWLTGEVWSSPARRRPSPSPMAPATAAMPPLSSTATW